jgi:hypothetical protein
MSSDVLAIFTKRIAPRQRGHVMISSPPTTKRRASASEAYSELAGLTFRYAYDLHEGDASFEYHGTLEVRCGADSPPRVVLDDLGGPLLASASPREGTGR